MAGRVKAVDLIHRYREIVGVSIGKNESIVYVLKGHSDKIARILKKMGVDARVVEVDGFTALNNEGGGDGA